MARNVLITGASGYLGAFIARFLQDKPDIERIVGIDVRPPARPLDKYVFLRHDVRQPIDRIVAEHAIDSIIHAAYVKEQIHSKVLMEDININGTKNVLAAAARAQVGQVICFSSATVYGFHADNPNPLREDSPLRANPDYVYSKNKQDIEALLAVFAAEHPAIKIAVLRPSFVVGKGFDDPLARHLRHSSVVIPYPTAPLQFVHEDDLVAIVYLMLQRGTAGTFNVGAEGTLTFAEMVDMLGNRKLFVPYWLMYYLNAVAWTLRLRSLSESPSSGLRGVRHPWIVCSEKVRRETGFQYRYNSREAFTDWVKHVKAQTPP